MKIYTPEECEKWIGYNGNHVNIKKYVFKPEVEGMKLGHVYEELADIARKSYFHNIERIERNIDQLVKNHSGLEKVVENLTIFMCPKPALGFQNATIWHGKDLVIYARGTQIPHCMTDYVIGHELGHGLQEYFAPDFGDTELWREYLALRNAPKGMCKVYIKWDEENDEAIYENREDFYCLYGEPSQKPHEWDERPKEWFAEDFRFLFGVDTGEPYWGLEIPLPDKNIKEYFIKLA